MNNNSSPPDSNQGSFGRGGGGGGGGGGGADAGVNFYLIALCLVPIAVCIIGLDFCCSKYLQDTSLRHRPSSDGGASIHVVVVNEGLAAADLAAFPQYTYAQLKPLKISPGCAVCLADYKDDEALRLLPSCGHVFHRSCIDPWLTIHPTCPICRSSPFQEKPIAPLANQ